MGGTDAGGLQPIDGANMVAFAINNPIDNGGAGRWALGTGRVRRS